MEKWYIVNEKIFELEKKIRDQGLDEDLEREWDDLVIYSRKIAGCVLRKTYEEQTKERQEEGHRDDVEGVPRHLDEEETLLGGVREVAGEGGTISILSPHLTEEQVS